MNQLQLQKIIGVEVDGQFGRKSRAALNEHFANTKAEAVTVEQMQAIADRLGCEVRQIQAVAKVESSGASFDKNGRPKILYERHLFHRATKGIASPSLYSDAHAGGYRTDSWFKLGLACAVNPDAAFASVSWGRFQVLGKWWEELGFESPYAMAYSTVENEAAHYELLAGYVQAFNLEEEIRAISSSEAACRPFAKGYNGPRYDDGDYDGKIARAYDSLG